MRLLNTERHFTSLTSHTQPHTMASTAYLRDLSAVFESMRKGATVNKKGLYDTIRTRYGIDIATDQRLAEGHKLLSAAGEVMPRGDSTRHDLILCCRSSIWRRSSGACSRAAI